MGLDSFFRLEEGLDLEFGSGLAPIVAVDWMVVIYVVLLVVIMSVRSTEKRMMI